MVTRRGRRARLQKMNTGGTMDEHEMTRGLGRRSFLLGAGATTAAAAATLVGCSSSDGDDAKVSTTTTVAVVSPTPKVQPKLAANPFTLGVASGDPDHESVVLWTRLAPEPLADDGLGGMPDGPAEVVWEVSDTPAFTSLRAAGVVRTETAHAHSAHVVVKGLTPGATVHYRFRYADWTSTVGATSTLPVGSPDSYRLAIANCQMYESGYYAAYRHMVDDEPDLVVHLGDYIYEYPFKLFAGRSVQPERYLSTEADFRIRYACYKLDEDLQAAHAAFPFIATWDDHEVANNYMGDVVPGADVDASKQRKAAAYQAWWEHQPTRKAAPTGSSMDVYQAVDAGDLFRLHLLDERQYADLPPCRDDTSNPLTLDYGDCAERTEEDRSRLGAGQEDWLATSLAKGGVTWNLLGNPVVLAGVDGGKDEAAFYLDTWDGYPDARRRLIAQLAGVDNPVVLTGDYHAGMTLEVRAEPFDQSSKLVAAEFMSPPISSVLFSDDVSARTPQLLEQINAHGYLTVDVTPAKVTVAFRCLADVQQQDSAISTKATWTVAAGDPTPTKV